MAKQVNYRQCHLRREDGRGIRETTTWLPERHRGVDIVAGVVLSLVDPGTGMRQLDRWTVVSVSRESLSPERMRERSREHTKWRKATDV